jgi:hypothetical protein
MKRTTILVCTLAAGMAWAQNPQIIQNTRTMLNTVQQNNIAASNEALGIKPAPAKNSTKAATTPAKASTAVVKTSATSAPAKPAQPKASPAPAKPNVVAAKSNASPAKPNVVAVKSNASSAKPSVNAAKSHASPSKATVVPAKGTAAPPKVSVVTTSQSSKSAAPFAPKKASSASAAPKLGIKQVAAKKEGKPATAQKKKVATASKPSPAAATSSATSDASGTAQSAESKGSDDDAVKDAQDKKWSMAGKRDPFISPVVSRAGGSGCSTGKKCLEIGAINLRGVVHSDGGFIAVVTNSVNKAYFLRENDPVFDGYVVKITGDSIIFKETMQDRLGKSFTREVTKKITTPAV